MASILQYNYGEVTVNGVTYRWGNPRVPGSITAASNEVYDKVATVATETTLTLFTAGTHLADFDFMLLESDQDLMVELVTDSGAAIGIEQYTLKLAGSGTSGTYGVPLTLGSDDSYANYTINFGGGTLDTIDIVRVRNLSATTSAEVHCLFVT